MTTDGSPPGDKEHSMIYKMVIYGVRKGKEAEVHQAIADFLVAIRDNEPDTHYQAFQTDKEGQFIHYMSFPHEAAERHHQQASYTAEFSTLLYPLCQDKPDFINLAAIP